MRRAVLAAVLALAALAPRAHEGQPEELFEPWRWRLFTSRDGLPSDRVDEIVEAHDGTPWASTSHGIAWFDGHAWIPSAGGRAGGSCEVRHVVAFGAGVAALVDGEL